MGLYDQALAMNAQAQNTALGLRQLGLNQPSAIERFMAGLKSGQEGLRQQKTSALQEMLQRSAIAERERKAQLEAEELAYKQSLRPMEEEGMRADVVFKQAQAQNMLTPKTGQLNQFSDASSRLWTRDSQGNVKPVLDPTTGEQLKEYRAPLASGGAGIDKAAIPGTAEWKRVKDVELKGTQTSSKVESAKGSLDELSTMVNTLKNHPGLPGLTGLRGIFPDMPGTPAYDAEMLRQSILSRTGMNVLTQLKQLSGAGLGQVTEAEHKLLQNYIANLARAQSPESMATNLDNIIQWVERNKGLLDIAPQSGGTLTPDKRGSKQNYEGEVSKSGKYVFRNGQWIQR